MQISLPATGRWEGLQTDALWAGTLHRRERTALGGPEHGRAAPRPGPVPGVSPPLTRKQLPAAPHANPSGPPVNSAAPRKWLGVGGDRVQLIGQPPSFLGEGLVGLLPIGVKRGQRRTPPPLAAPTARRRALGVRRGVTGRQRSRPWS